MKSSQTQKSITIEQLEHHQQLGSNSDTSMGKADSAQHKISLVSLMACKFVLTGFHIWILEYDIHCKILMYEWNFFLFHIWLYYRSRRYKDISKCDLTVLDTYTRIIDYIDMIKHWCRLVFSLSMHSWYLHF